MAKLTLTDLANLQNENTAVNAINNNSTAIEAAVENTLSRDGTAPNGMGNVLDMNGFQILNLPAPATDESPLRLQDLETFIGGGTITGIPAGGSTNQVLAKLSNADYNVGWTNSGTVTSGTNISVAGVNPYVVSTVANPNFATSVTTPLLTLNGTALNSFTGTGSVVLANTPTLTTPVLGAATATSVNKVAITAPATSATLTIPDGVTLTGPAASGTAMTLGNNETVTGVKTFGAAGNVGKLVVAGNTSGSTTLNATATASGTLTLPAATDTLVGKATTDILTNKTFNSTGTGNVLQVSGVTVSAGQYPGEPTTGSATAGNVGEYVEAILASGSATALTTATPKTITSISLTAGDWDVTGAIYFIPAATTSVTRLTASMSLVTNTTDTSPARLNQMPMAAVVSGGPALTAVLPVCRFSLSGTTTIFLVSDQAFTVSTLTGFGIIRARRIR